MSPCGEYCSTCCEIKEALPAKVTDAVYDNLCRGEGDAALVSLVNQLRILLTDDPETTGLTGGKDEKARQLKILSAHVKVSYPLYNEVEFRNTYKDDMQKIPDQPIFMWPNQEGEEELVTITAPEKRRKLVVTYGLSVEHEGALVDRKLHPLHIKNATERKVQHELGLRKHFRASELMGVRSAAEIHQIVEIRSKAEQVRIDRENLAGAVNASSLAAQQAAALALQSSQVTGFSSDNRGAVGVAAPSGVRPRAGRNSEPATGPLSTSTAIVPGSSQLASQTRRRFAPGSLRSAAGGSRSSAASAAPGGQPPGAHGAATFQSTGLSMGSLDLSAAARLGAHGAGASARGSAASAAPAPAARARSRSRSPRRLQMPETPAPRGRCSAARSNASAAPPKDEVQAHNDEQPYIDLQGLLDGHINSNGKYTVNGVLN